MFVTAAFFVLGTVTSVSSVEHSLTYIYTAFSKPVKLPGIHEFTAMGLLDNRMIDYYDSTEQKKIPKQDWMKERLQQEYWDKGTQSRQSKQQWFKVNIDILINRMRQTSNDTHVLQWMHGCEGVEDGHGNLQFMSGVDMYNYDGDDFLAFDDEHQIWVATLDAAVPTKRKWDEVTALKDYTKGYLEKECMEWMNTFLSYSKQQLKSASSPDVFLFASEAKEKANVVLTCLATGFYPKDITMNIRRDGRILTKDDGVVSSGVRPNQDDTHQRRDHVEILRTDVASYTCEIIHPGSNMHVEKPWDHRLPTEENFPIAPTAAIAVILVLIGIILFVLYKRGIIGRRSQADPVSVETNGEKLHFIGGGDAGSSSSSSSSGSNESISKDSAVGRDDEGEPLIGVHISEDGKQMERKSSNESISKDSAVGGDAGPSSSSSSSSSSGSNESISKDSAVGGDSGSNSA
ncbi:class I histocompatibility antigen, F10 alpha chain isoform X4 [Oryzias latipes]|uniref:class I histocompatibility antigen, F10 alpha chain isoform X4 n=1 Tax=Oryzias latipes TaxID=8090 RepID=UPI000CE1DE51|nr:class I histocompatibility antigen, F10 alpha chain isoform X4 [Oryzias latipes]